MVLLRSSRFLLSLVVLCLSCDGAAAQPTGIESPEVDRTGRGSIRGRVVMPDGSFAAGSVKITLQTLSATVITIYTDNQGQFEFPKLLPALYTLEVEADRQKFEVVSETVQVYRGMPSTVTINLKAKKSGSESRPEADTVSVVELTQRIPPKALKEYKKAREARNADAAILHLRKAIDIFPDYIRALSDLGSHLLVRGQFDEAAEHLQKAVSLDPRSFYPVLNLGIVFVRQQRFQEASELLRTAVSFQPSSPAAQFYLGLAFLGLEELDAAEAALKTSHALGGSEYAIALFHLGELYMRRGDRESALKAFSDYLTAAPDARNANQVRKLIEMMRP